VRSGLPECGQVVGGDDGCELGMHVVLLSSGDNVISGWTATPSRTSGKRSVLGAHPPYSAPSLPLPPRPPIWHTRRAGRVAAVIVSGRIGT